MKYSVLRTPVLRTPVLRTPVHRARSTVHAFCIIAVAATAMGAQNSATIDQATFMVARKGAPVGRESFSVVRTAGSGGQVFRAQATSAVGETRFSSVLATDSLGAPVTYELRVSTR